MADEFDTKIPKIQKSKTTQHLNRQIPPEAHTPMYNWHKYWSRKTWNVVGEFIKTYCPEKGIVFDPFSGSGVSGIEALRHGRKAIIADISPVATEIARLTIKPVSLSRLNESFKRVEKRIKNKILSLYLTECRNCGYKFPFTCAIWQQSRITSTKPINRKCLEIRYSACPKCGDRREKNTFPTAQDQNLINQIDKLKISQWFPNNRLYHVNGKPFKEKQKYESLDELFTKRNLYALALLMEAIEQEPKEIQDFLKIGFTSAVHLCSAMLAEGRPGYRPFSGVGWNQQSYWFVPRFMESNVWIKFESAILGHQGLLNAKKESNNYFTNVRFAKTYQEVIENKADIYIYTGSSFDLMKDMTNTYQNGCIDYIFTDPPYDSSIQYGELSYLWVAWLKKDNHYLEKIRSDEVINNRQQEKSFDVYHALLSRSFQNMFTVLKPDKFLTVTFHNPTFKIRNATIRAGVLSGFELEKIHHQELARPSAKSLLQPFGSAQGDFYLRFHKPDLGEKALQPEMIDETRFEKIVVDTAIKIIAERGEETPYTIIINAIDPELARRGFFSELKTGLDVKTVLENHLTQEFIHVETKKGGAVGKLWWFKNPAMVSHLEKVPLTERVERVVLMKLQQKGKVTFTEIWNDVSTEFPNSLTSDQMSIKEALMAFAKPVPGGFWLLKPNLQSSAIEKAHTTMMAILCEIGKSQGFKIWVGKIEQTHKITALPNKSGELKQYISFHDFNKLRNVKNLSTVADMDILWIKDNKIISAFEVESTTSMTSALQRGSNLQSAIPKYILIPEDRDNQLLRKLKSPMFQERFTSDNWQIIYFEALSEAYSKHKGKTNINELINKKLNIKVKKDSLNQLGLFIKK